jgi:23S rRNA (uracil1939-C5)-methyltransferase
LVSIPNCRVHHPSVARFLAQFVEIVNAAQLAPYQEARHEGLLRAVQLAVIPDTGKLQVVLLVRDDLSTPAALPAPLLSVVETLAGVNEVHSVFLGALPHKTNTLTADRYVRSAGPEMYEDCCAGAANFYPPSAFGQANPLMHRRVVERVGAMVSPDLSAEGGRVVEYYCGVGTIGLSLKKRGHDVVFNELGAGSIEGLKAGFAALGEREGAIPLYEGKAAQHAELYKRGDVVIVDPPRKGLDGPLLARLLEHPPQQLVYLSCGLDSLIREMSLFAAAGAMRLEHISGWSYFPFTEHIETLLVLKRKETQ